MTPVDELARFRLDGRVAIVAGATGGIGGRPGRGALPRGRPRRGLTGATSPVPPR